MNHGSVSLRELRVLAMDCQATSSSTKNGHLIEVAWAVVDANTPPDDIVSTTVALPDDVDLPPRVSRLTGISPDELDDAPSPGDVAGQLRTQLDTWMGAFAVAHWARFESAFIERLLGQPLEWVCTHSLIKRLVPGLPRKGLRAVSGYFGRPLGETKRAAEHVDATAFVWREIVGLLEEEDVRRVDELWRFLETPAAKTESRTYPLPRETRLGLPDDPGVYRMLGRDGAVLYVGKASSLKDRVNSYFRQRRLAEKKMELVSQVWDLDVTVTDTALEAALMEADEIKRLSPPYNRRLRRRDRQIAWAARDDFRDVSPTPTDRHQRGPFSSRKACERFAEVIDVVNGEGYLSWFTEADTRIVEEAVAQFRDRHGIDRLQPTGLLRLGRALHPLDDDEEDDGEIEVDAVTVEHVLRVLERTAVSAHRSSVRGRWLQRLSSSRIRWTPHRAVDRVRELAVEETLVATGEADAPGPRPRSRSGATSLDAYDRLSVLLTELRRIVRDGREVEVTTVDESLDAASLADTFARF